ncbi:DUF6086 family protein [Streptomyces sp. DW26H14]|uniref:DUF6086 family protein n=1 Tax=Streptomyces sp. DW26H14 TaxID=3435395 RepID=UPI00403D9BC3
MSCFFEVDGETVWNPASAAGRLFVDCARAMERFSGARSGISDLVDDEYAVDLDALRTFHGRLTALAGGTGNAAVQALTAEFLVVSAVLLERAGATAAAPAGTEPSRWRARLDAMARSMPR